MWTALEAVGLLMVVAFAWFIWPPLPLLVGGVLLVAVAYVGESRQSVTTAADEAEQ